jgi:predicted DNA-binding antitoxin AbrB/MazE fold protein
LGFPPDYAIVKKGQVNFLGGNMEKTIRAKFKKGVIEPLEKLELKEGEEVEVTLSTPSRVKKALEAIRSTAGAWKETIDCEELIKDIYESRRLSARRPEVKL